MFQISDMEEQISQELYERGIDDIPLAEKKECIESVFQEYTKRKFHVAFNAGSFLDLISQIASKIGVDNEIFHRYTTSLLDVIESIQKQAIIWQEHASYCGLKIQANGKVARFSTTDEQTEFDKFAYLYQEFKQNFFLPSESPYLLQKRY